eukprot:Pgem_evm1s12642
MDSCIWCECTNGIDGRCTHGSALLYSIYYISRCSLDAAKHATCTSLLQKWSQTAGEAASLKTPLHELDFLRDERIVEEIEHIIDDKDSDLDINQDDNYDTNDGEDKGNESNNEHEHKSKRKRTSKIGVK